TANGGYVSYSLSRSERLKYGIPWTIGVSLDATPQPTVVYSPTHAVTSRTSSEGKTRVQVTGNASDGPGPFRLLWKRGTRPVDGFVVGYPPQGKEDGYFLWVVEAAKPTGTSPQMKREVTLCIDRSGSMKGQRLSQVRGTAGAVLNSLRPADTFNIISFNEKVDSLSKTPLGNTVTTLTAARTYLKNIRPGGGSDIYSALETALNQPPPKDRLPIVLFFTDGLPSGGKSNKEVDIRNLAIKNNPHRRRVYTFGVDVQVNSPLLQRIADETGGQSLFVLPKDSVADKAAPLLKRLQSPVLTGATMHSGDANGKGASGRFHAVLPARVPDLFAGDRLVVVGRYRSWKRTMLTLTGTYFGKRHSLRFEFDPKTATTRNTFIPRLWAARRVAQLVDIIRQRGATYKPAYATPSKTTDPTVARCSREVLDLTARHGVVTEYTAFLAAKGSGAFQAPARYSQLLRNFDRRAAQSRVGLGGVSQEYNANRLKEQTRADRRNWFWNSRMQSVRVNSVQPIGDTAMFRQKNGWIDGRLLNGRKLPTPTATVTFGSSDYWKLVERLSANGRQRPLSLNGNLQVKDGSGSVLIRRQTHRPPANP
ncbi:MAG: VWA domain-containing protein, partial [Planctomycetaceae bacterium]